MNDIKKIEETIKALTTNVDKLKALFDQKAIQKRKLNKDKIFLSYNISSFSSVIIILFFKILLPVYRL